MHRKHFKAIANVIKNMKTKPNADKDFIFYMALELGKTFKEFNSNFDEEKFMSACGYEKSQEVVNI